MQDIGGAYIMAKCEICEKTLNYGNKLSITRSHISKRTSRTWKPNLRTVKTLVDGQPKKIKVCAKCLRSGKVTKA
jgi:large subunit ribosomal protein L28